MVGGARKVTRGREIPSHLFLVHRGFFGQPLKTQCTELLALFSSPPLAGW